MALPHPPPGYHWGLSLCFPHRTLLAPAPSHGEALDLPGGRSVGITLLLALAPAPAYLPAGSLSLTGVQGGSGLFCEGWLAPVGVGMVAGNNTLALLWTCVSICMMELLPRGDSPDAGGIPHLELGSPLPPGAKMALCAYSPSQAVRPAQSTWCSRCHTPGTQSCKVPFSDGT